MKNILSEKFNIPQDKIKPLDKFPFNVTLMNRVTFEGYLEASCYIFCENGNITQIEKSTKGTNTSGFISLNHVYGKHKSKNNTLVILRKLGDVVLGLEWCSF